MKKRSLALMLSAAPVRRLLLAGCGSGNTDPSILPPPAAARPSQESTAALSGTVNTNGSTSMGRRDGLLWTEGFKGVQPGITVNYTSSGSSAGVTGSRTDLRHRPGLRAT